MIGKALGVHTRPAGAKSSSELREEFGVSRSVMQKVLRRLVEEGKLERIKIIERDPGTGKAQTNTVYRPLG